mgnify:CR=1 FL=1
MCRRTPLEREQRGKLRTPSRKKGTPLGRSERRERRGTPRAKEGGTPLRRERDRDGGERERRTKKGTPLRREHARERGEKERGERRTRPRPRLARSLSCDE